MTFTPAQTALVLGGGGAKGAYEIGAICALRDMGIEAGSVYGTSIGAINAAMVAQGNLSRAAELWENIRLSDVVTQDSLSLADDAEDLFGRPEKLLEFITRYAQNRGIDVTPLRQLLTSYVDEIAIRRSHIRFGLVTTRFPSLAMVEKRVEDMAPGSLVDWLMASAACFPVFPMQSIGEERYLDGGYCDNVPVDMAIRSGARRIIAIDIGRDRAHAQYDNRPNITYIRTSHPLGGLLTFDPAQSARNRILGYNDTMRAFGQLRGTRYSFDQTDTQGLSDRAQDFLVHIMQAETAMLGGKPNKRDATSPLFSVIEEQLAPGADAIDYFLRACELCAEIAGVNPAQVFKFPGFVAQLYAKLPLRKAESMLDGLLGGRIGVLFSQPEPEKKLVIACLYHLLVKENGFNALAMRTLASHPKEMLCALTLRQILPDVI